MFAFFLRLNYKDKEENIKYMHSYNVWVARNIGLIEFLHTFDHFYRRRFIEPKDKTIMNRYDNSFFALYELKGTKEVDKVPFSRLI